MSVAVTESQVAQVAALKYGDLARAGWGPRLRSRFGYFTPDDWYEAVVRNLVQPKTEWLDVGCGRDIFPSNAALARELSDRCQRLTGLDPSDNIDVNPFVHERAKCMLEDYQGAQPFDLITMRMVAEHIEHPAAACAALARLCRPGGHVVIYTVAKWSPAAIAAAVTPMSIHHRLKAVLWQAEERDTFPTIYRMNTRATLRRLMQQAGFAEQAFRSLPDTRTTNRFKLLNTIELGTWRVLRTLGVTYPERCLLGIYGRQG